MRVLWLTNIPLPAVAARQGAPGFGGGGWLTAGLAALTAADPGLDVVCAARAWPAPDPFEERGVRYVTLPATRPVGGWRGVLRSWTDGRESGPAVDDIRALIDRERPDLVHVHGTETSNALGALLASDDATPVLVSLQGLVSEISPLFLEGLGARDVLADLATADFLKGRGLLHAARRMRRAARTERATLLRATDVAGRTAWDRAVVTALNPGVRYLHLGEALRPAFESAAWSGGTTGDPLVLAVTSAAPYKGIDVLLRGFARLLATRPARLRVVGDIVGTPLWRSVARLQDRLGVAGRVEWAGPRDAAQVAAMMAACDVFVCASRIENSSNSVCEAMMVGAPVVASRAGGIPSLIDDGADGLLFEPGDDAALASSLERVLDDPDLAGRLGAAARATARERHDPAVVSSRTLDVYRLVASREGGPS